MSLRTLRLRTAAACPEIAIACMRVCTCIWGYQGHPGVPRGPNTGPSRCIQGPKGPKENQTGAHQGASRDERGPDRVPPGSKLGPSRCLHGRRGPRRAKTLPTRVPPESKLPKPGPAGHIKVPPRSKGPKPGQAVAHQSATKVEGAQTGPSRANTFKQPCPQAKRQEATGKRQGSAKKRQVAKTVPKHTPFWGTGAGDPVPKTGNSVPKN